MLGARAAAGRLFGPEHDRPGVAGTAVLSHGTWMRRYGGAPSAIGRTLTLNGQPYQIIGVLPETFSIPREVMPTLGNAETSEILLPLPLAADAGRIRNREDYNLLGRLKPGVTDRAGATGDERDHRAASAGPSGRLSAGRWSDVQHRAAAGAGGRPCAPLVDRVDRGGRLRPDDRLRERGEPAGDAVAGAPARDRGALGARRPSVRIVRQLLTESVALALAGGAVGLWLGWWSLAGIRALGAGSVPRLHEIAIDGGCSCSRWPSRWCRGWCSGWRRR